MKHWSSKLSLSERTNFKVHEQFNANLFKFNSAKIKNVKQTIVQLFLNLLAQIIKMISKKSKLCPAFIISHFVLIKVVVDKVRDIRIFWFASFIYTNSKTFIALHLANVIASLNFGISKSQIVAEPNF